jgi:hypothetical protein
MDALLFFILPTTVEASLLAMNVNAIHLPEHKRRKALAIALTLT